VAVPKNSPSGKGKGTVPPGGFGGKSGADERLRARVEGKVMSSEEAAELLKRLEAQLAALRNKHEQYFLGLDRQAPDKERDSLKKQIDDLKFMVGRNTALKFGVQSLFNRFLSYERMWLRTEKDIEEGRYVRDIFKARLRSKQRHSEETDPEASIPPGVTAVPAKAEPLPPSHRPPATAATAIPKPPPVPKAGTAPPGMIPSEDKLRAVYQAYVSAKKQCKESTAGMSFEQVADQLRKQVPQILSQTKAKAIDFKVVIKDGKATLRAVPKE
jgi:hypothetical protein